LSLINVDPENPANTASPQEIRIAGFGGVRLVSRPEVEAAAREFQAAGLFVLSVVTEQSGGFLIPDADLTQIGNEPDIDGTADSMGAREYADYARLYRDTYPGLPMITAGLASNQPAYLKAARDAGGLKGFLGVGLHYPTNLLAIGNFARYTDNLPLYVTEWWTDAPLIPAYRLMLRQSKVAMDCRFSWGYDRWALTDAQKRAIQATN
jgi:hypothetical protein